MKCIGCYRCDEKDRAQPSRYPPAVAGVGHCGQYSVRCCAIGLLIHFGATDYVLRLLRWFHALGVWAPLLFILLMAAVVVLLPGVLFTTGAGFVFGVLEGSLALARYKEQDAIEEDRP